MDKFKQVALVIIAVIAAYIGLLAVWDPFTSIVSTSSNTVAMMPASGNFTGASGALDVMPWALMFVPAAVGVFAIVVILKRK